MVVTGSSRQRGGDASVESAREVLPGDVQERESESCRRGRAACVRRARAPRDRERATASLDESIGDGRESMLSRCGSAHARVSCVCGAGVARVCGLVCSVRATHATSRARDLWLIYVDKEKASKRKKLRKKTALQERRTLFKTNPIF